jgi:hypothetical protein
MAITYTWLVESMDTAPSEDGLTDVVKTVHWRANAEEVVEAKKNYTATVYGSVGVGDPTPDNFVDYANLTEADVLAWVWDSSEDFKSDQEANLANQIEDQKNPKIETLPNPWAD